MTRLTDALRRAVDDVRGAFRIAADRRSATRLATDFAWFFLTRVTRRSLSDRRRRVVLRDGRSLSYRMNAGDLQSIREVWIDQIYRLPFELRPRVIVDLGANVGLTARWLSDRYQPDQLVCVEADDHNAALLRENLPPGAVLIEAAVGPLDGSARFAATEESNLGQVTERATGREVRQVSMFTVLEALGSDERVELLKLDIEGSEQALLTAPDVSWLARVDVVIAEFHPEIVDYPRLVEVLRGEGFRYFPAGLAWPGAMDVFRRERAAPFAA